MDKIEYILGVGAINIDICGFSYEKLLLKDSNPGVIKYSHGGVTRNIIENARRLGSETKIMSVVGKDSNGNDLLKYLDEIGVDTKDVKLVDESTSSYLAILDDKNDMYIALSDMNVLHNLTPDDIKQKDDLVKNASIIVLDACLSYETIDYILTNYKDKKIYLDPVSIGKIRVVKDLMHRFYGIKLNEYEAMYYTGLKEPKEMANYMYNQGIKEVVITFGSKGVYIKSEEYDEFIHIEKMDEIKNASGAGDSYMGALLHALNSKIDFKEANIYGVAASRICLMSEDTINKNLSKELLEKELK